MKRPLSSCYYSKKRYLREKQKEGCGSMLPLTGFTMVILFILHEKSDALQLCRSLQYTNSQIHKAISQKIGFPKCKMEIIILVLHKNKNKQKNQTKTNKKPTKTPQSSQSNKKHTNALTHNRMLN